jgi:NAD(P)-dependent dehydrogenase (short-subunit alcohol dehydrogenase family)
MGALDGKRALVVGASKGLGRAVALRLAREGAAVSLAARSTGLLEEVQRECGNEAIVVPCDVRDPDACTAVVTRTTAAFGGLDALIYAPGKGVVSELWKTTQEQWRLALDINVVGAGLVTGAAVPHLEASQGAAIYFSSVSANLVPPWIGLGLYLASKAALEKCVQVWKLEHPTVRFSTIVVGSTAGGEFFHSAEIPDPDALDRFRDEWWRRGYIAQQQLVPEDQAKAVVDILTSDAQIDVMWVRSRTSLQLPPPDQAPAP